MQRAGDRAQASEARPELRDVARTCAHAVEGNAEALGKFVL